MATSSLPAITDLVSLATFAKRSGIPLWRVKRLTERAPAELPPIVDLPNGELRLICPSVKDWLRERARMAAEAFPIRKIPAVIALSSPIGRVAVPAAGFSAA